MGGQPAPGVTHPDYWNIGEAAWSACSIRDLGKWSEGIFFYL